MTQEVTVKFEKTHPDAVIPEVAYEGDACFDLLAVEDVIIPPAVTGKKEINYSCFSHSTLSSIVTWLSSLFGPKNLDSQWAFCIASDSDAISDVEYKGVQLGKAFVPVGLRMELPLGWEATFRTRSSFGVKNSLRIHPGTIDAGYRGDLMVAVYNMGSDPVIIKKGQGVAQVAVRPVPKVNIIEGPIDLNTDRGTKGFGSSDKV